MVFSDQERICENCGKKIVSETAGSGSITQWIASVGKCACQISASGYTSSAVDICNRCGRRLKKGRSGSFTQWIFRSDLCACDTTCDISKDNLPEKNELNFFKIDSALAPQDLEFLSSSQTTSFPDDRYDPLSILGRGASGTVYKAKDKILNKKVAVKTLLTLEDQSLLDFQYEARTISKLSHPNIVEVLDFGANQNGYPFMVMELVEGMTLAEYLKKCQRIPIDECRKIFFQAASALEHANSKGIYHRDIKPSNLLIEPDGNSFNIKVVDFGIALAKKETLNPTHFKGRQLAGTPEYMSPDSANGLDYDSRSEIYSLGCVIYECLTGKTPFPGDNPLEILSRKSEGDLTGIYEIAPDLEADSKLAEIVHACLEASPEKRFQNFKDLLTALEEDSLPSGDGAHQKEIEKDFQSSVPEKRNSLLAKARVILTGSLFTSALIFSAWYLIHRTITMEKPKPVSITVEKPRSSSVKSTFIQYKYKNRIIFVSLVPETRDKDIAELAKLKKVEGLFIMQDNFNGHSLDKLYNKGMLYLCLNDCNITQPGLEKISKMTELEELYLKGVDMFQGNTRYLSPLNNLKELSLSETRIYDRDLLVLKDLPELEIVYLNDNPLSDKTIDILVNLPKLRFLSLNGTNITEKGLDKLTVLKKLEHINIVKCFNLTENGVARFKKKLPACKVATSMETYIGKEGVDTQLFF